MALAYRVLGFEVSRWDGYRFSGIIEICPLKIPEIDDGVVGQET